MGNKRVLFLAAIISCCVFIPSLFNQFTNWDDDKFIINNKDIVSLSLPSIQKIFTSFYEGGYQPLTQLSFAIDYHFWQLNPLGYHLTNVICHVVNTVLVLLVMSAFGLSPLWAFIATLLWATHPMRVESVAWVSERKDVLFGCWYLLAALFYLNKRHIASWVAFVAACLTKHQAAFFAFCLPVFDMVKPDQSQERFSLVRRYVFFAVTGVALLTVTTLNAKTQWTNIGMFDLLDKIILIGWGTVIYAVKSLIPYQLSVLYPYPAKIANWFPWYVYAGIPICLGAITILFILRRHHPIIVGGGLLFAINIFLPLMNVMAGGYFINDRYTYIASIGIFLILGFGAQTCWQRYNRYRLSLGLLIGCFALIMIIMTINRIKVWHDGVSLWTNVIEQYPKFPRTYDNRATAYGLMGQDDKALRDLNTSIQLDPKFFGAYNNRAVIFDKRGEFDKALADWDRAIALNNQYAQAYYNRGIYYYRQAQMRKSFDDLMKARQLGIVVPDDFIGYVSYRSKTEK